MMHENLQISYQEINEMLSHFCRAFSLRIGIHDENNRLLTEFPGIPAQVDRMVFCDYVAQHSAAFDKKCLSCDQAAFQIVRKTRRSYLYPCHMGFKEAMIPIYTGDTLQLVLMIGQLRQPDDTEASFSALLEKLTALDPGLPERLSLSKLRENWLQMSVMEDSQLESVVYLLEICAAHIRDNHWIRFKNSSRQEQICQYLAAHYQEDIHIGHMAEALHLSTSHLSRLLKQLTGTTFTECLTKYRIQKAVEMLTETRMTTGEIAYAVGYNDPGYFTKVFKKAMGMPPSLYRTSQASTEHASMY